MQYEWNANEKWFGECRLVVRARKEEVAVRFGDGASGKRYEANVGEVECCECRECVRGVLLDTVDCSRVRLVLLNSS